MMNGIDQASAGPYTATPYADGVFTWNIPWQFRVGTAGVGKQFAVVLERFVTDSTGKLTASKGGTIVTRYLNDPTTSY